MRVANTPRSPVSFSKMRSAMRCAFRRNSAADDTYDSASSWVCLTVSYSRKRSRSGRRPAAPPSDHQRVGAAPLNSLKLTAAVSASGVGPHRSCGSGRALQIIADDLVDRLRDLAAAREPATETGNWLEPTR